MSDTEYARLGGAKKLTLLDAVAQSIGFIGPVFSIAFLVPLVVGISSATGKGGGNAAVLSVVIASIGVLGLSWIVSEYARRIHAAGSLYDYVTDGLGAKVGAAAGLVYYVGILVLGAGLLVMIGGVVHDTLDGEFSHPLLPRSGWDIVLLVIVAAVLYLGAAVSTRTQLILALISITVVLLFSLYVIVKVGSGNHVGTALNPSSSPTGLSGVLFGVLYGVLLFTGFETSANLGEETENPKRDIPRAVLASVLLMSGFFVVGTYAQVAGFHFDLAALKQASGGPLFALASPESAGGFGSDLLRRLVELVVVLDMLAVLIGVSVAASRGFFAMARDHRLPKAMAAVSGRGVPAVASSVVLVVYAVVVVITKSWVSLFALPGTPHYVAIFSWFSTFGSFSLSLIYLLMSIGALKGLRDHADQWKVYLAVLVGVLVTAGALFGAVWQVPEPTIWAPYASLGVLVIGAILAAVVPGRPSASSHFAELADSEQGPVKL